MIGQTLTNRAFKAGNRMALGKARKVRFKGKRGLHQIGSLEGKSNAPGLRWRPPLGDDPASDGAACRSHADRDPVIAHGLAQRIKYVWLVRRVVRGRLGGYAQLIGEGLPLRKVDPKTGRWRHLVGAETVALDNGPSTIAVVGETQAELRRFAPKAVRDHAAIRRLQRRGDRQRRANNPDCYDVRGRALKGKDPTRKSRRQRQTEADLAERYRREAAHRTTSHGHFANQILARGATIHAERLSYKAFQKRFGRSIGVRASKGFLSILTRKAESAGGQVIEFNPWTRPCRKPVSAGGARPSDCPRAYIAVSAAW